jgi:3D-(3,5/4)-trihydroxycyclohexane-1,2-dione acylhydrolase (decyclizing)
VTGIFGHGNVAGIGEALVENPDFPYILTRHEQAAVHLAAGFAKMSNRLRAFACTSSIGPGATNMITGAAGATINRLPVLLLPGDIFARRNVAPVLQQLESPQTQDVSVNDCFRPILALLGSHLSSRATHHEPAEAMRVLTSPADTGAVTLCLPQDVQTEAFDFPEELFDRRVWLIAGRNRTPCRCSRAAEAIRASRHPIIIAGGGVLYSEASQALAFFASHTGIPVAETYAGKGSVPYDLAQSVGSAGATGSLAANPLMLNADLVIGIGTRYSDFTTASMTAFQHPHVRSSTSTSPTSTRARCRPFLVADARVALEELSAALAGYQVSADYTSRIARLRDEWALEVNRLFRLNEQPMPAQSEIIGAVWAGHRSGRRARFGRRRPSRRSAQALADASPERFSSRIWILVHGV